MVINGKVGKLPVSILLDPGATDNFINPRVVKHLNLKRVLKHRCYTEPAFGAGKITPLIPGVLININEYKDCFHQICIRDEDVHKTAGLSYPLVLRMHPQPSKQ